jgi:hypothetical protein
MWQKICLLPAEAAVVVEHMASGAYSISALGRLKKRSSLALVPWKNSHSHAAGTACIDCGMQIHVRLRAP